MSASVHEPSSLPVLLTIHDIAALFQVRRTAAYARTHDPDFPDPLVISDSCYRWYSVEVLSYLESRRTAKKSYVDRTTAPLTSARVPSAQAEISKARMSKRGPRRSPDGR